MRIHTTALSKLAIGATARRFAITAFAAVAVSLTSVGAASANSKYAGIVMDARTGKTLYSYKADSMRYPASLTKMMTLYMVFDALERGQITKKTRIRISKYANGKPPSRIAISTGKTLSVDSAIRALVTKSANNVAAAVAEHLGGTEGKFARMMTRKARALGMSKTTFRNASGLTSKGQLTTARDMAKLGLALREHFPREYKYFSTRSFKYGKATYGNHNRLLGRVKGVDGIKTGYTRASGFNLVSSVSTGGRKIVAVVMGGRTGASRNAQMQKLISQYLRKASKRGGKQLIASKSRVRANGGFNVAGVSTRVALPKKAPLPNMRAVAQVAVAAAPAAPSVKPTNDARISGALVASAPLPRSRPTTGVFKSREELAAFMAEASSRNAVPSAPMVAALTLPSKAPATAAAYAAPPQPSAAELATASITTPPKGWHIQIGAVPNVKSAKALHSKAQKAGSKVLGRTNTWTQDIDKNGTSLYRVRFTGFDSKTDARNACKYLKARKFDCLAIQQS
ncbi:MAG: D-alanyl-D-alanine carboxypeptidase [Pseudomonadota bacterium]